MPEESAASAEQEEDLDLDLEMGPLLPPHQALLDPAVLRAAAPYLLGPEALAELVSLSLPDQPDE